MDNELRRELIAKSPISFLGLKKLNAGAGIFLNFYTKKTDWSAYLLGCSWLHNMG